MKAVAYAVLLIPAAAVAQTAPQTTVVQPQITAPVPVRPVVVAPLDLQSRLKIAPAPCLARAPKFDDAVIGEKVIGEKSTGIIGEKGEAVIGEKSTGVIGEKSEAVIGEKSTGIIGEKSEAVIGEKSAPSTGSVKFGDRWEGAGPISFQHMLAGSAGRVVIRLDACSSAPGGQIVRVRGGGVNYQQTLVATPSGSSAGQTLILPKALAGQKLSRVPLTITVENPGGKPASGYYAITITR